MLRNIAFAIVCLFPGLATAQGLPGAAAPTDVLQPLATSDDIRPFAAVGRLDTGTGFCTATLITYELVLTAAHCLFDAETGERRPDEELTFNAGLSYDLVAAQRGVRMSFMHPDYQYGDPNDVDRVRTDLAILRLDRPIELGSILPIRASGTARRGDRVHVVSYGHLREEYPSLEEGCGVLAEDGGVYVLDCSVVSGSSGSPVMVATQSGYRVVAVVSASAHWRSDPVALTAQTDGAIDRLMQMAAGSQTPVVTRTPASLPQARTLTQSDDNRDIAGARFIQP